MQIIKKLIKYNFSSRNGEKIKYIVIHTTANSDKGADAMAHYNYFNGADRQSSADYFVDDHQIVQLVEDFNYSWAVGDGKNKYGISNKNSISVELCENSDGNYDMTVKKAIELTKYLMQKYNIPIDRVVRHWDASRKICPRTMYDNNWAKWKEFKKALEERKYVDYTAVITKIYKNMFQREPDSEGLQYWNDRLNKDLSIGDFMKIMAETEEFKQKYLS